MKPSEIKLLTTKLEAKGYRIHKGKSSWDNTVSYSATHPNELSVRFAPGDSQTIQTIIKDCYIGIKFANNEIEKYHKMIDEKLVDPSFVDIYSTTTLDALWDGLKMEYEKQISNKVDFIARTQTVIADLEDIATN
ncbi:hypothetical protein [Burkholderia cenocepacia]|uniref:hypothetical protein n=1 Tax=Burkholderia cenocepacia TaxID=95486 RepID=UPI0026568F4D|nr:hypothetical protein [Burkholderia cenocepacia]MDN7678103.1 hypothetical protein [Burkholderia cenocepacia]